MRILKLSSLAALVVATASAPIHAQWVGSVYGTVEVGSDESNLVFAGATVSPNSGDVSPFFSVQGYRLSYKIGSGTNTAYVFKPAAGLRFRVSPDVSANASVGYAFTDKDIPGVAGSAAADRGDGVVIAGGLDVHPAGKALSWEAMASYNLGAESFWGRARAPIRLASTESGSLRFAPELSFINATGYNSIEPGAVLLWQGNSGFSFGAGLAFRMPNQGSNSTVFKVEAAHSLF